MSEKRRCIKGTRDEAFFNCSCDDCARAAASAWCGLMDLVFDGRLSLEQVNRAADEIWGKP